MYLSTPNIECHQSSWNISYVHARVEFAAQSIVHQGGTVCIAQSCAYVIAMNISHSIGDQNFIYLIMMVMVMVITMTTALNRKKINIMYLVASPNRRTFVVS